MSYDPEVAGRVRRVLADQAGVAEKRMVGGGLSFLVNGNMCCGVRGQALMVRVGADGRDQALGEPHVRPMLLAGRALSGFITVEPGPSRPTMRWPAGCSADWISRPGCALSRNADPVRPGDRQGPGGAGPRPGARSSAGGIRPHRSHRGRTARPGSAQPVRLPGTGATAGTWTWAVWCRCAVVARARPERPLATAGKRANEGEDGQRQQRPEDQRTETRRPAPAAELWSVPEHGNAFFLQARAVRSGPTRSPSAPRQAGRCLHMTP